MFSINRAELGIFFLLIATATLQAQDKIFSIRGNEERVTEGLIVGTTADGSPRIRTADGIETVVKVSEIRNIIKDEPPELQQARIAFFSEDYQKAIELAQPVAERYSGLPIGWAVEAFGILADSYLEKGDIQNAKNWYQRISQAYGQTPFRKKGDIGIARIAFLQGDSKTALTTIRSIVEQAKATLKPNRIDSIVFAEAFYLLAKMQEEDSKYADALESYLRIPALYPENPTLVKLANDAAARLQKEHNVNVN